MCNRYYLFRPYKTSALSNLRGNKPAIAFVESTRRLKFFLGLARRPNRLATPLAPRREQEQNIQVIRMSF